MGSGAQDTNRDIVIRIAHGVYKVIDKHGQVTMYGGSLYSALEKAGADGNVFYLSSEKAENNELEWIEADTSKGQHYHAEQCNYLHHLLYITNSPLGDLGFRKLASIIGISGERVRDAMRSPANKKYTPFSNEAMRFIHYKMQSSCYVDKIDPKYRW